MSTWQKASASEGWIWLYLKKMWYLRARNDWTHRNGRKKHFNYYKLSCPRFFTLSSLFDDFWFGNDNYILVLSPTDFADRDGIKTTKG